MPYRIGMVGSDNSHAITFSQIANGVDPANRVSGFQATHLFGLDEKRNLEVAEKGKIPNIVSDPSKMIGEIDIAFIEFRHGGLHLKYARPFIEAGVPVFVDKPLAADTEDARKLVRLAASTGIPFTSFSTLRFTNVVQETKNLLSVEEPVFLSLVGPGDLRSEYGGLIFYGIHLTEIFNEIVGHGVKEVFAMRKAKDVAITLVHDRVVGTLKISPSMPYLFAVECVTKKSHHTENVDTATCYKNGMMRIKEMLDTRKWPLSGEDMFEPVAVIEGIVKSMAGKKRVNVGRMAK